VPRFDRYLLSQLMALFGFFALVLVGVYWINHAVGLFDRLIGDGQSALVFLEFSLLTLPNVVRLVLPIAAFAASVYVANRLMADSELVVMQATGFSAFRLARPVFWFGAIVACMMLILMHVLVPASRTTLAARSAEIAENITARFLQDGRFMHPAPGITIYIREITPNGELRDIFLQDGRDAATQVIYTASRALLVRSDDGPKLIMFDGMAQRLGGMGEPGGARLGVTRFADFTHDLGNLIPAQGIERRDTDALPTRDLIAATPALLAETGDTPAGFAHELHTRIATPLLALAAAVIGFAALLVGAFSRFGLWRQIGLAVVLLILIQMLNTAAAGAALRQGIWALAYVAPGVGIAAGIVLLWIAQAPRRIRGAAA
jgi:lipopolysaccharide export system permease protein